MTFHLAWLVAGLVVVVYAIASGMGFPGTLAGHPTWAVGAVLFGLQLIIAGVLWAFGVERSQPGVRDL